MSLADEISAKAKEIYTDAYSMSIGELMNLYADAELDIHPEFQRFYRWSGEQKSKLIESILLGIPIPNIFVSQRSDGVWDVIDGVQRLSTIFEFVGILRAEDETVLAPLRLIGTEFLPSLQDKIWRMEDEETGKDTEDSFTSEQRLFFKRSKIDVKIVKKESDDSAKYELFQRLNTGGSDLSHQEVRNCLMLMINPEFYRWLNNIRCTNEGFIQTTAILPSKAKVEQYDMELLSRLLIYRHVDLSRYRSTKDLQVMIGDEIKSMCSNPPFDLLEEQNTLDRTFSILSNELDEDVFRKFNIEKSRFEGAFSVSIFEAITPGISKNLNRIQAWKPGRLCETIKSLSSNPVFIENTSTRGVRPINRARNLISLSERLFSDEA
ncbi:MAG: DUF262 domain-containing protein [Syntrophomonas sp.]